MRGKAAQSISAAFLLAGAAIRKIRTLLATAVEDPGTTAVNVARMPRTGEQATTDLPPGVGPPETAAA